MIHLALFILFLYPALTVSGQIARMIAIAMCLLCCTPKFQKATKEPGTLLMIWFAWAFLCSLMSDYFTLSLFGFPRRWEGLATWALAISFGWMAWRSASLNAILTTCIMICSICLLTMMIIPELFRDIIYTHIAVAAFVSIVACMLMAKHFAWVVISLPFLYFTQNRTMIVAMAFGVAAYVAVNHKKITKLHWYAIAALSLAVFLAASPKLLRLNPYGIGQGARVQMVQQALDHITMKPFMGYGIDTQSKIFREIKGEREESTIEVMEDGSKVKLMPKTDRAHNFLLDLVLQTGFIGLAIWLFSLTRMGYSAFNNPTQTNLACFYGIAAFMGYGLLNPSGIPSIFLACLCIMGIERKEI